MTVTQAQGVDILKALNANPGMKGHSVSVGTGPGIVWLNGSIAKPEQRALAEKITRRAAPKSKVVNQLKVVAAKSASNTAPPAQVKPAKTVSSQRKP
jgi:osmotically-inducible protein OsmY